MPLKLLSPIFLLVCVSACTTARPVARVPAEPVVETVAAPQADGIVPLTLEQDWQISE